MTPFEFWYGDIEMLDIYVEAYNNRVKNTAILNGLYTYIAVTTVAEEILSKEKTRNYIEKLEYMELMATANQETKMTYNDKVNFWSKFSKNNSNKHNEEGAN